MSEKFENLDLQQLDTVHGGMGADARWIMMHESGGRTNARNPTSSAFGAFQMIRANRIHYMGRANANSTNLDDQYRAASRYVGERYGGWHNARVFWQRHHWY